MGGLLTGLGYSAELTTNFNGYGSNLEDGILWFGVGDSWPQDQLFVVVDGSQSTGVYLDATSIGNGEWYLTSPNGVKESGLIFTETLWSGAPGSEALFIT